MKRIVLPGKHGEVTLFLTDTTNIAVSKLDDHTDRCRLIANIGEVFIITQSYDKTVTELTQLLNPSFFVKK